MLDASTQQDDTNGHYVITRFTYDDIGRNKKTSWEIDGNDNVFEVNVGFDTIGRLESITYPRLPSESELLSPPRFKVNYEYSPVGYLVGVTDAGTGVPYWTADTGSRTARSSRRPTATAWSGCASTNLRRGCCCR